MNRYFNNYKLNDLYEIRDLIESNTKKTSVLQKKLNKLNLNIVANGESRIVLENLNQNFVIKIQKTSSEYEEIEDSFYENKIEAQSYNMIRKKEVASVFAPVIDVTENFNILSQVKVNTKNISHDDVLKVAGLLIYKYGYYIDDLQTRNIGKYKKNKKDILCVIDYGAGVQRIKNSSFDSHHDAFKYVLDTTRKNKIGL